MISSSAAEYFYNDRHQEPSECCPICIQGGTVVEVQHLNENFLDFCLESYMSALYVNVVDFLRDIAVDPASNDGHYDVCIVAVDLQFFIRQWGVH